MSVENTQSYSLLTKKAISHLSKNLNAHFYLKFVLMRMPRKTIEALWLNHLVQRIHFLLTNTKQSISQLLISFAHNKALNSRRFLWQINCLLKIVKLIYKLTC